MAKKRVRKPKPLVIGVKNCRGEVAWVCDYIYTDSKLRDWVVAVDVEYIDRPVEARQLARWLMRAADYMESKG